MYKKIQKLEKQIQKLDNKIANTNLFRQIYILPPLSLAILTAIATIVCIPINMIAFQVLGVTTIALTGGIFALNAFGIQIDSKFALKLNKLNKKMQELKAEKQKLREQIKVNSNDIKEEDIQAHDEALLKYLLEEGKRTNELKLADVSKMAKDKADEDVPVEEKSNEENVDELAEYNAENSKLVERLLERGRETNELKLANKIVIEDDENDSELTK